MTAVAINRRGECPALTAPMPTGDGLLVRLNPVSQGLTPKQLIGLCNSAMRHGNGIVEITARGSFQIRGLTAATVADLTADVNGLGIEVRTGVPVETSPLAGIDPTEIADPRPLTEAIRAAIADAGLSRRLGPKVSVVVDGGGAISLGDISADVRLEAQDDGLWRLAIGGTAETAGAVSMVAEDEASAIAVELLAKIAAFGPEARGRDLALAHDRSRPTLPPSVLSDISPTRGEIGSVNLGAISSIGKIGENIAAGVISPLVGEMSDRTEGGNVERRFLNAIRLKHTRLALAIYLPYGSALASDLAQLASSAEACGISDLRLAPGRRLLVICPNLATAETLAREATRLGFITDPADPRLAISACPGAPACGSAHFATRDLADELVAIAPLDGQRTLHISGCAKGCAHPAPASLTLVGGENGVGLVVNGTARDLPLAYAEPKAVPAKLARLSRLGAADIAAAFSGHKHA